MKKPPVKKHNELSKQFPLGSYFLSREDHNTVGESVGKRIAGPTLNRIFKTSIADLFNQKTKTLTKAAHKKGLKHIHTTEMSEVCTGTSKLLQTTAPEIKPEEKLPREAGIKLAIMISLFHCYHQLQQSIKYSCT